MVVPEKADEPKAVMPASLANLFGFPPSGASPVGSEFVEDGWIMGMSAKELGRQARREIRRVRMIEETNRIGRFVAFLRRKRLAAILAAPENAYLRRGAQRLGLV